MASNLSAQLDFLTDAAHRLTSTAPETSAYLMSRRTNLMLNHDLELSDMQRQHVCSSCGYIMIPGQEASLKLEAQKAMRSRRRPQAERRSKEVANANNDRSSRDSKTSICGQCGHDTKVIIPTHHPTVGKSTSGRPTTVQKVSANASSKQRAKSRKAGLQALLARSEVTGSSAGHGLTLSDFIKK